MPILIRAEDVNGLLTIEDAIDAVEAGFREWGTSPELNAPRRRIMTPQGVRVSVHPGGIPSLGGIGGWRIRSTWQFQNKCKLITTWGAL